MAALAETLMGFGNVDEMIGAQGLDAGELGPAVWSLQSTPEGFVCTVDQLAPVRAARVE